jgi:DNA polymerase-3 subunit gamma/tau
LEPGGDKLPPAPYVPKTITEEPAPKEFSSTLTGSAEVAPPAVATIAEPAATETGFVKPSIHAPKKAVGKFSLSSLKEKISSGNFQEENTEVAEEELDLRPGQQKPIEMDSLRTAWFAFAQRKNQEGKVSEYMILNRNFELQNGIEIHLKVDNPVQVEQFNDVKAELLGELRRKVQNNKLNVIVEFVEVVGAKRLYTSIDKYNFLAEKYPALTELKQRLGLDTDF